MNVELARAMVRAAFRVSGELQDVLQLLKENCPEEEYRGLARGIAAAIDHTGVALTNAALASHPELEREVEASIAKYGRYL